MADSLRASARGLKIVDEARRKKGWTKTAMAWSLSAATAEATLKRFWRGLPILSDTFVSICQAVGIEDWESLVATELDVPIERWWAGRRSLIRELAGTLRGECRILILSGITGLGKTALGNRLSIEFMNPWIKEGVNFDAYDRAPGFASVAAQWLSQWNVPLTPEERKNPEQLVALLMVQLRHQPYWIQVDSLEALLTTVEASQNQGSEFIDPGWAKFFRSVLSEPEFQSRLVLTSQDIPIQIADLRYQGRWVCEALSGLTAAEQLELFLKAGLAPLPETVERDYLKRIGRAYEGHPLALQTIAGEMGSAPFHGNIAAYWKKYGHEIEAVEQARQKSEPGIDPLKLHTYTRNLFRQVQIRVEKSFERLRREVYEAYGLLCEASVYRRAVPEEWWLAHLEGSPWNCDAELQMLALDTLRDRHLVEEEIIDNEVYLRLHTLIRSVALEHLKNLALNH